MWKRMQYRLAINLTYGKNKVCRIEAQSEEDIHSVVCIPMVAAQPELS